MTHRFPSAIRRRTEGTYLAFELGLGRETQMCGTGHLCSPLWDWFRVSNNTNAQGMIDVRYSGRLGSLPFSLYAQEMNEVQSNPLSQEVSHLAGVTFWSPLTGYRLSFQSADVSHPLMGGVVPTFYNAVTTVPVHINMVEARISVPFRAVDFELAFHAQDGQPRPESGATAAVELAIKIRH